MRNRLFLFIFSCFFAERESKVEIGSPWRDDVNGEKATFSRISVAPLFSLPIDFIALRYATCRCANTSFLPPSWRARSRRTPLRRTESSFYESALEIASLYRIVAHSRSVRTTIANAKSSISLGLGNSKSCPTRATAKFNVAPFIYDDGAAPVTPAKRY